MPLLLFLFIAVPVTELVILVQLAHQVSWPVTLALVFATGILGASLARWQGWRTIQSIQAELRDGRMPTRSLLDAGMILVAGALLLTPGILTDLFGFSLLVPACRRFYQRAVTAWVRRNFRVEVFSSGFPSGSPFDTGAERDLANDDVIDARVVQRVDEP